jgi:HK97 family phage prohead protease
MEKLTRTIELDTRAADDKARTVPAVVSTSTPVDRGGFFEVLLHTKKAIDLSRAPLPLLTGHDARSVNIGLVENLHLDGNKLRGTVRLGHSKQADDLWPDIQAGIIRGVSVGYTVAEWRSEDDTDVAVRWQPHEISLIGVAADPAAGLNRNQHREKTTMTEKTENTDDDNVIPHKRWLKQEKRRRDNIRVVFTRFADDYSDLLDTCLDDPQCTIEQASEKLLRAIGDASPGPLGGGYTQSSNGGFLSQRDMQDVGANRYGNFTARDTLGEFTEAATDGILQRGGIKIEKPHPGAVDVRNMRMSDVAETMLRQFGVRTSGMNRDAIVRKALSTRGFISHSSSDFPNLLENIASKSLLAGFNETPAIYRSIARIGNLPDFKQGSRTALSDFSDLEVVYENGEYKYGSFNDLKETLTLQTFGKQYQSASFGQ